jgi:hypothetical protein
MKSDAKRTVEVSVDDLALLCLSVDYRIPSHARDLVEELSVKLAKKHKFDTHLFRLKHGYVQEQGEEKTKSDLLQEALDFLLWLRPHNIEAEDAEQDHFDERLGCLIEKLLEVPR